MDSLTTTRVSLSHPLLDDRGRCFGGATRCALCRLKLALDLATFLNYDPRAAEDRHWSWYATRTKTTPYLSELQAKNLKTLVISFCDGRSAAADPGKDDPLEAWPYSSGPQMLACYVVAMAALGMGLVAAAFFWHIHIF